MVGARRRQRLRREAVVPSHERGLDADHTGEYFHVEIRRLVDQHRRTTGRSDAVRDCAKLGQRGEYGLHVVMSDDQVEARQAHLGLDQHRVHGVCAIPDGIRLHQPHIGQYTVSPEPRALKGPGGSEAKWPEGGLRGRFIGERQKMVFYGVTYVAMESRSIFVRRRER